MFKKAGLLIITFALCLGVLRLIDALSVLVFQSAPKESCAYDIALNGLQNQKGGQKQEEKKHAPSLQMLMQQGDAQEGKKIFQQCALCHTAQWGAGNRVGPALFGVYNRSIASLKNFSYSQAMRNFAKEHQKWDGPLLYKYLQMPQQVVPGTAMSFAGITSDQDRADLILYLKTLVKN